MKRLNLLRLLLSTIAAYIISGIVLSPLFVPLLLAAHNECQPILITWAITAYWLSMFILIKNATDND